MKRLQLLSLLFIFGCSSQTEKVPAFSSSLFEYDKLSGNTEYLTSPFVTAGDRVYIVGHQDGSFPDLGWHVTGEMGGVWNHPIKLLDGFSAHLSDDKGLDWCLTDAKEFINYPIGNRHLYSRGTLSVERFQFVPEGMEGLVVEYTFHHDGKGPRTFNFSFTSLIDLMPVWLSERLDWEDGSDELVESSIPNAIVAKDDKNDWYVMVGSELPWETSGDNACGQERMGTGFDHTMTQRITVAEGNSTSVKFFISGSYESLASAESTLQKLKENSYDLLDQKIAKYNQIKEKADLAVPDEGLSEMYKWIKYNSQWLVRDVPEQGRGVSAGIPDYPWWFGTDGAYIIQGLLSAGMHEEALSTIDLIIKLSREENNNSGQIVHEVSTNGVVFNPGNLNTIPTFIHALWKAFTWTGDQRILDYYQDVKNGITWIECQDKDGNGYPDGAGMMEIHGLHSEMIDVVAYQYQAYVAAVQFAEVMKEDNLATSYWEKANVLREKINSDWWVEEFGSYADFRATKQETIELIEAAIVRADTINKPWSSAELEETLKAVKSYGDEGLKGCVVHHNWVVNTPMEVGAAEPAKAEVGMRTAEKYRNRFGMFVTGIDRDENQEKAEKWKAFSYVGAVMTLPTGVQAISEARYGNPDKALKYLKMLENSFGYALPGSMYEVSPDFGMVAQGWNIYSVAVPIVDYFFGIQPEAHKKRIIISPDLPASWPSGELRNIPIGDNFISISFERDGEKVNYSISQSQDWELVFVGKDGTEQVMRTLTNEVVD